MGMSLLHGWGWQLTQTTSCVYIRHVQSVWAHWYAVHMHFLAALNSYCLVLATNLWLVAIVTISVHLDNVLMPPQPKKVLGGGANSPPMQPSLQWQISWWTWCYVLTTQHHQLTTPSAETIRTESSNNKQINGMVSALGGVSWWRCKILIEGGQKL